MNQLNKYLKRTLLLMGGISLLPLAANAKGGSPLMELAFENIFLILAGLVIIAAAATLINMVFNFIELQKLRLNQELGIEKEEVTEAIQIPSWKKIYDKMWNLVPKDKEETIDLGHDYDGIRELDNKLPPWWVGMFYGTIIFAVVYLYIYQWGPNEWSSLQEYNIAMEDAEIQKEKFLANSASVVDENTVVYVDDKDRLLLGEEIFVKSCAACHGVQGQGIVGPNLTDDYWIHGGSIQSIFKTIKYGVPEKGMIAWASQLKPTTMQNVASYIQSLKGTNPPNPKDKEGELYVPEESTPIGSNDAVETEDAKN
ncbi:cbb3-type cytochrome c oxidase N-terminal domain-containing protein [Portibacter lacus]|uniref:Cytochrome c domain-containing protein n=1 Tax=Portibacter lacus TaxID=1099794 RepID=A0AA37SNY2_9BACT|nr:cbb3-type cytochrome c oxidase N-terminal domain-containing protein [Portibacter lacus]GLR17185.1 hypothetical protein GCM10007940_18000 [Portibacter lacus]